MMLVKFAPDLAPPTLWLYDKVLEYKEHAKYTGIHISGGHGHAMFRKHYDESAKKARKAGNLIMCIESKTGSMDPDSARTLYMAQMDPYLISGFDISPDTNKTALKHLEVVQQAFWRRVLRLSRTALTAFLWSETGIWPIEYRRFHLLLRYLQYLVALPESRLLKNAVLEVSRLAEGNCPVGWYNDVRTCYSRLMPTAPALPPFAEVSHAFLESAKHNLRSALVSSVARTLDSSPKAYLVSRSLATVMGHRAVPVLHFQSYLRVTRPSRRRALVKMLLSDHRLALERLRWIKADRNLRLCRHCEVSIESPEHAMFECPLASDEVIQSRDGLLRKLQDEYGLHTVGYSNALWKLRTALCHTAWLDDLAELAWAAWSCFEVRPIRLPRAPAVPVPVPVLAHLGEAEANDDESASEDDEDVLEE